LVYVTSNGLAESDTSKIETGRDSKKTVRRNQKNKLTGRDRKRQERKRQNHDEE
jgi:hypothetical protein